MVVSLASRLTPLPQTQAKKKAGHCPAFSVYGISSPSTFCGATQTFDNRVIERVAMRQ